MQSFKSFLAEDAMQNKIEDMIRKIGYTKFKWATKKAMYVYVEKSDRAHAIEDIADKLGGTHSMDPALQRKFSSIGAVTFSGKMSDYVIGVKPDMSSSLSTDEQETLAGIFIATRMHYKKTDYSFDELEKYGDPNTVSAYKIANLYDKASKGWIQSSTTIARDLIDHLEAHLDVKRFEVHQRSGSKFEANISKAAKALLRKAGKTMGLDKWNPADIWLVHKSVVGTKFSQFKTIHELNKWLWDMASEKKVLGISLKQAGKKAHIQYFNLEPLPSFKFESIDVGKKGFDTNNGATIWFDSGSAVIRSFGRPTGVNVEINGKLAQGGKVGTGPLFSIIKEVAPRFKIMDHKEITRVYQKDPDKITGMILDNMKKLDPQTARKYKSAADLTTYLKGRKENDLIYVISKLQSSTIALTINSLPKKKKDEFIEACIGYARSSTSVSSIFIKVS